MFARESQNFYLKVDFSRLKRLGIEILIDRDRDRDRDRHIGRDRDRGRERGRDRENDRDQFQGGVY